eukprot:UN25999
MVLNNNIPQRKRLFSLMDSMSSTLQSCLFIISNVGIRVSALDEDSVCMVDLWLPKEGFLKYDVKNNQETKANINLAKLKKMLSWVSNVPLKLSWMAKVLRITQESEFGYSKQLELEYINIDENGDTGTPKVDFLTDISFKSSIFSHLVKCSDNISDTLAISVSPESVSLKVRVMTGKRCCNSAYKCKKR